MTRFVRFLGIGGVLLLVALFSFYTPSVSRADNVTDAQVAEMITGGQEWLKAQQVPATYDANGNYTGGGYWDDNQYGSSERLASTALAVAALIESGVPRTDQHVVDAINFIRSYCKAATYDQSSNYTGGGGCYGYPGNVNSTSNSTYKNGSALIALGLYGDPPGDAATKAAYRQQVLDAVNFSKARQRKDTSSYDGSFGYSPPIGGSGGDTSNTQFGAMGIFYGSRFLGLPVVNTDFANRLFGYVSRAQDACGGGAVSYSPSGSSFCPQGAETGAGLWMQIGRAHV